MLPKTFYTAFLASHSVMDNSLFQVFLDHKVNTILSQKVLNYSDYLCPPKFHNRNICMLTLFRPRGSQRSYILGVVIRKHFDQCWGSCYWFIFFKSFKSIDYLSWWENDLGFLGGVDIHFSNVCWYYLFRINWTCLT